jgi:hypothetical protein
MVTTIYEARDKRTDPSLFGITTRKGIQGCFVQPLEFSPATGSQWGEIPRQFSLSKWIYPLGVVGGAQ